MRAEDDVRLDLLQMTDEFIARMAGENPAQLAHLSSHFGIVGFAEDHAPQFRRLFDQRHIAILVDFFVKRGKEFDEIQPFDNILRPGRPPGLLQGRRRRDMPATRRDRRNENTHDHAAYRGASRLRSENYSDRAGCAVSQQFTRVGVVICSRGGWRRSLNGSSRI